MSGLTDRARRGASLIEVLTAAAILLLGAVGVVVLLTVAARSSNDSQRDIDGALLANAAVEEVLMRPYGSLALGTFDAGTVFFTGTDGGPALQQVAFTRTVTITNLMTDPAAIDAGAAHPGFVVRANVVYRDGLFQNRTQTYASIYSHPHDGGN
jgi:Tfp pilus assembly protein PilV